MEEDKIDETVVTQSPEESETADESEITKDSGNEVV